jgi:hypothetical protein
MQPVQLVIPLPHTWWPILLKESLGLRMTSLIRYVKQNYDQVVVDRLWARSNFDESWWGFVVIWPAISEQISSTLMQLLFLFVQGIKLRPSSLIDFELVQILMRVDKSGVISSQLSSTFMQTRASQLSSTLMQLLFSFDRGMRVEKALMMLTLASQLSCNSCSCLTGAWELRKLSCNSHATLVLVWPGYESWENSHDATCQLSSTLMQLLFSFDRDMRVEKTLVMLTLACQLSSTLMQLLFSFDRGMRLMRVEKALMMLTLACQLSSTLIPVWPGL